MDPAEPVAPDLAAVVHAAHEAGLPHVVIGGFGVVAHGYIRATRDCDLLIPDGDEADQAVHRFLRAIGATRVTDGKPVDRNDIAGQDHMRVYSVHGMVDLVRGGSPPLDFETVDRDATDVELFGETIRVASLRSLVSFKRLAGRPLDKVDLAELEAIHGELPVEHIPGLDD